jgi:hypothetical protein
MIDSDKFERHQQYVAYLLSEFTVPHLVRLVRRYDGDVLLAIVLGEIAQHNVRRFFESPEVQADPALQLDVNEAQQEVPLGACNALSISRSTGIPRETVRRRVEELVRRGWVRRDGRGHLRVADGLSQHFEQFDREHVEHFLRTAQRLAAVVTPEAPAPA